MAESNALGTSALQRENIVYDKEGNAYIAASQRPDGTWRKARRVKPGYFPQEEVPVYQSKGKLSQGAVSHPFGSEADSFDFPIVDASTSVLTRAQKKNMRKKQKKKKELKQKDYAFEIEEVLGPLEELKVSPESISTPLAEKTSDVLKTDHSVEATKKKLRTLKKKLKQIEELEEKLCLGELNPNKEQLNKIARKEEFVEEIEALTTSL